MKHRWDAAGWCDCGARKFAGWYLAPNGETSTDPPPCTRSGNEGVPVPVLLEEREARRHRVRVEAGRKGWDTRRYRAFEDTQRPLPFRGGLKGHSKP